jgi:hypothetical protein
MRTLRVLALSVAVIACTTHSRVEVARPGPNVEVRDGTCAEQRAARADQPIVDCYEYTRLSPLGGFAIVVGTLAVASLMLVAGIRDIGEGLGKADDH